MRAAACDVPTSRQFRTRQPRGRRTCRNLLLTWRALSRWWETFGDEQLTALVRRAVTGNLDVRTAISRVREARATMRSTRTQLLPRPTRAGSARGTRHRQRGRHRRRTTDLYSLGVDASWELDVFGGIRSTVDAARATADARDADLQDVLISLTADVALNYIDIRSLQRRIEIAQSNINLQQETLELTQFRAQAGLATDLDVQQALANVESTRAQIASLESAGRTVNPRDCDSSRPAAGRAECRSSATAGPIPEAPIEATLGVPADALRRRPDVRSAERQFAAQAAQVNVGARRSLSKLQACRIDRTRIVVDRPSFSCRGRGSGAAAPRPARGCSIAGSFARTSSSRTNGRSKRRAVMKPWSSWHCRRSKTA